MGVQFFNGLNRCDKLSIPYFEMLTATILTITIVNDLFVFAFKGLIIFPLFLDSQNVIFI